MKADLSNWIKTEVESSNEPGHDRVNVCNKHASIRQQVTKLKGQRHCMIQNVVKSLLISEIKFVLQSEMHRRCLRSSTYT